MFTQSTQPALPHELAPRRVAKKLDRVAEGKCRRLMVFMPPQHGKSELVSRRFPAYMLGRNPNVRLIGCSHTHKLAVSMNRDVQRIMTSPAYEGVFRSFRLEPQAGPRARRHGGPPHDGFFRDPGPPRQPPLGRSAEFDRRAAGRRRDHRRPIRQARGRRQPGRSASGSGIGMPTISTGGSRPTPGSCSRTPAGTATTWRAGCCGK